MTLKCGTLNDPEMPFNPKISILRLFDWILCPAFGENYSVRKSE